MAVGAAKPAGVYQVPAGYFVELQLNCIRSVATEAQQNIDFTVDKRLQKWAEVYCG